MRKGRFMEHRSIDALRRAENGMPVKDICRELSVSDATFYKWCSKYGGMQASELKRRRELEDENRRLKQMYAKLSLDHEEGHRRHKALMADARRLLADYAMTEQGVSKRRVCRGAESLGVGLPQGCTMKR